jgi:uncharacterized repeat protein (TIGR02543 family)
MAKFVHVKRFIPLSLFFPLLLLSVCISNNSNPIDPNGDNYTVPSFTINSDGENIGDDDTIHKTSAKLVVAGNQKACLFQVKVDNRDTTEWQSDGIFLLQSLSDGSYDVLIKCKYNGGTDVVTKTIHFVALTEGYVPRFINARDSQVYTDTAKTIMLNAAVTGPGPFTYQWYKDSVLLEGKVDSVLVIDAVKKDFTGVYYCIVTNQYDSIKGPSLTVSIVGKEKVFSIIYHGNGSTEGLVPVDGALYGKGDIATVKKNTGRLEKSGFEFNDWCMDSLCLGDSIKAGSELIIGSENVHLYAKWKSRPTFTVTYNGNGNTGGKVPFDPMSYVSGQNVTVKKNPEDLVKDGYFFSGWNTQADGLGNPYSNGEDIVNISKDIILYARWTTKQIYLVMYNGNGNTSGNTPVDANEYDPYMTTIVKENIGGLEKAGYQFVGWNTSPNGSGINYSPGVKLTLTHSVMLYAKWTQRSVYSITYDGNGNTGGSVPLDNNQYEPGQKIVVKANTNKLVRDNFTFAGWNTRSDGKGIAYAADVEIAVPDSNIVLYAKWAQGETYTVVYNGNGNIAGEIPVDVNNYELHSTAIVKANDNNLIKKGYRFTGWCFDKDGNGQRYAPQDSILILGNTVLYAVWTQIFSYSVIYDGNGNTSGEVPVDTNLYEVGSLVMARGNQNNLAKEGFKFAGWNTKADGSGTKLYEDSKFIMDSSNVKLYAYWTQNETFSVTYVKNGSTDGEIPVDNNRYESDALVSVMSNYGKLAKAGYTFAGWNTKADGSGTPYAGGTTFRISENTTLYAKWSTQRTYTVSYQGNGNTVGTVPVDYNAYEQGNTAIVSGNTGNLQKDGYSFTGWNVMADGTGMPYSPNAEIKIDTQNVVLYAVWTRNTVLTYKLTYNNNQATSGTVPVDNSLYKENSAAVIIGNTGSLVRSGYTFAGWCRSASVTTAKIYMPGDTIIMSGDIILYACWTTEKMYMIVYSGNGSTSGAVPKDENSYLPGVNVTVKGNTGSLVKSGYTFVGWNTKADGSGASYLSNAVFVKGNGNDTLYAKWSAKPTYTVTYNLNNAAWGTVPSDANTYEEGAPVTLKTNSGNLGRNGYTFKGWNTRADGTGAAYPAGGVMTMPGANTILYADWNLIVTFTVTYNGNGSTGGSVPFDPTAYTPGANVVVKGNTGNLIRSSYNFAGWNTRQDGNGAFYIDGWSFAMGNANVTLYAVWTQNPTYKVYYNGNWASTGNTPSDNNNYRQGDTVTILGNIGGLARNGYTFAGWATNSSGTGTLYTSGSKLAMGTDVINLYAVWKPVTYYVVFDDQDATTPVSPDSIAVAYLDTCVKTLPAAPAKTGYLFGGWYTSKNGTGSLFTATTRVSARMTVFANWLQYYSVSYNSNSNTGGSAPSDTTKYLTGAVARTKANSNLVKTGYTFANWNSTNIGSGKFYAANDTILIGRNAVVLYAAWRATILFDGQGATTAPNPATVSLYFPDTLLKTFPSNPSRTGYTFTGWYTATSAGTEFTATTKVTANDTVFARWSINRHTITYDGNGHSDGTAPSATTHNYNSTTTTATAGTLVLTGYRFTGWNTAANGSGTAYTAGATIVVTSDITLYAQWTENSLCTLSYNGNGNTSGTAPLSAIYSQGDFATVAASGTLARTGYTFTGWNTTASGNGTAYNAGSNVTMTSSITLYAQWTALPLCTLSYNGNGNTTGTAPVSTSHVQGESATAAAAGTLSRTGHTFAGWNTSSTGDGTGYAAGASVRMATSLTLYAQWTALPLCTLSYNGNGNTTGTAPVSTSHVQGESATAAAAGTLSRTGHTFAGWNTSSTGDGTGYAAGASVRMATSLTLYAQWTALPLCTLSYNGNGNTTGTAPVSTSHYQGVSATVATAGTLSRTGYTFAGWNTTATGDGTDYAAGASVTMTTNLRLYAKWLLSFNVTYNGNGNTSGVAPVDNTAYTAGQSATVLGAGSLNRNGYQFVEWNTDANGSGTTREVGSTMSMTSDVALYAVWTQNASHSITFSSNSGSAVGTMNPQSIIQGVTATLSPNTFTNVGYTFSGWSTSTTGAPEYTDGASYTMGSSDVTLYAIWATNE